VEFEAFFVILTVGLRPHERWLLQILDGRVSGCSPPGRCSPIIPAASGVTNRYERRYPRQDDWAAAGISDSGISGFF
jgi:hypothetical protein